MTYTISPTLASVLRQLEECMDGERQNRTSVRPNGYTADTRNERVISRIIGGPASVLIPPESGRSRTRGMRP